MPELWQYPVTVPAFVDALAAQIVDEAIAEGPKPTAFDTRLRFSGAGKCSRQIAYNALGAPGDGIDPSGLHVAWVGTRYHEWFQAALQKRYPGCEIEVKGHLPELTDSGSADAIIRDVPTLGDVAFELKTKSSFQFDQAMGYMRKAWNPTDPKGPAYEVILQAGLNAAANDCTTLVIGYVTFENISIGAAEKLGLRHLDRFLAEWHIPQDVWVPMVDREMERLRFILDCVNFGTLPEREVYGETDDHDLVTLDPEASKVPWFCQYCNFRTQCTADGPGLVPVPVELKR